MGSVPKWGGGGGGGGSSPLPLQRKDLLNSTKDTFTALLIRICISSEKSLTMAGSVESLKLQSHSNN